LGAYAQLIARFGSVVRCCPEVRELYDHVARGFLDAMIDLKPNADRQVLATVLTLTVSSMLSIVASSIRVEALAGKPAPTTPLEYRKVLLDFCSGGLARAIE